MCAHTYLHLYIYIFCNPSASVSVDFQSVLIDSSIASSASRVSLRLSVNPGHYFLSHVPPTPAPPPRSTAPGGAAPAVLSRRSVCVCVGISRLLRAHHALFAARRHLPLPLWPFSRIRSFIYPGRLSLLVTLHANARPRAPSTTSAGCCATSPDVAARDDRSPTHVFPFSGSGSLKCQRAKSIIRRKRARL